ICVMRAPARINILGEHVDYVSYLRTASLPFASREHAMVMLFRARPDDRVRGISTIDAYPEFAFAISDGPEAGRRDQAEQVWLEYLHNQPHPAPHWANYVKGAVYFAGLKHGPALKRGLDFLIDSSIPPGGGASSSSALSVLTGAAIRNVNGVEYEPQELAR